LILRLQTHEKNGLRGTAALPQQQISAMGIARPFRQRMKDSTDEFLVFISWHFSSVGEVLGSSGCFSSLMNRPKLGRCS
jgi:hypothetical protein